MIFVFMGTVQRAASSQNSAAWPAIALAMSLAIAGCATRPTAPTTHTWSAPCDDCLPGVVNFARVTDRLWRGSQPDIRDPEVFRKLAQAGVKTVINLRHDHDDFPDLQRTDIAYVRIPMRAWHPQEEELVLFLAAVRRALADPSRSPVFVHCAEGKDRTGYAIAMYRIVEQRWDADSAIEEMFDYRYNPVWFGNPSFLRRMAERRADIATRVARAR
jgi:tyrosine-protein phosphatase SIW14